MFANTISNSGRLLLFIVLFALALGFSKIGLHNVREWDEARNGVNAFEMLKNGDYVNLYYEGVPDTWNAKPPLFIWLIALSYKLFGFNEFALRLPTLLSVVGFLVYCFKTVSIFERPHVAFFTCLVLLSSKAVFGLHIGLTADFDGTLLLFITASVYHFVRYLQWRKLSDAIFFAVFTGLGFYTKGPAALVLTPGFLLYAILKRNWWIFKSPKTWGAVLLLSATIGSWFIISARCGIETKTSYYGSKNAVETMLLHDIFQRLTNPAFDITGNTSNIYLFFFEVLDARLNLWNYVFYSGALIFIYLLFIRHIPFKNILLDGENQMVVLSLCLTLPLSVILTFAATKNNWYLAPVFMFVAFIAVKAALYLIKRREWLSVFFGSLLLFTLIRQIVYVATLSSEKHMTLCSNQNLANKQVFVAGSLPQDLVLYLKWLNATEISHDKTYKQKHLADGTPFIIRRAELNTILPNHDVVLLTSFSDFYIGVITNKSY